MAEQYKGEELKGRAKKAAGDLARNKKLRREGKVDQVSAFLKRSGAKAKRKVTELTEKRKRPS